MTKDELLKINEQIETIDIRNKVKNSNGGYDWVTTKYATVSARVLAFRTLNPDGRIITQISYDDKYVYAEAQVFAEKMSEPIAVGHAREFKENRFAPEVAESSAIGRALGFVGIGIQGGISTAEDIQKSMEEQLFDDPRLDNKELAARFCALYTMQERVQILNHYQVTDAELLDTNILRKYVEDRQKK